MLKIADGAALVSLSNKLVMLLDAGFILRSGRHGGKYRIRVSVSGGALEAREVLAAGVTKQR
jgi:hypothetical protein